MVKNLLFASDLPGARQRHAAARLPLRIVEHHSPILDVLRAYPIIAKMEVELFERVLGVPIRREESAVSGLFCATFYVGGQDGASQVGSS